MFGRNEGLHEGDAQHDQGQKHDHLGRIKEEEGRGAAQPGLQVQPEQAGREDVGEGLKEAVDKQPGGQNEQQPAALPPEAIGERLGRLPLLGVRRARIHDHD